MSEEIKEIDVVETEVTVTELEPVEEEQKSGVSFGKVLLTALGAGTVILAIKGRKKIKAWGDKRAIKRLEKTGRYEVVECVPCDDAVEEEAEIFDEDEQ